MKILIHSNASWGGIVDYMILQARALTESGHDVALLVPENFDKPTGTNIEVVPALPTVEFSGKMPQFFRRTVWVIRTLRGWKIAVRETLRIQPDALLLSAYAEYLSPLWKHHFTKLRKQLPRLKIGAIVHDPVRQPFGPVMFHRRSVRNAYEILDVAYVHHPIELDQGGTVPCIPTIQIPFGVFHFPSPTTSASETRAELNIPNDAIVLFAFGHIRDSKNLDLAVKCLEDFPMVYLLIAGKSVSSRERPASFYEELATTKNVRDRLIVLNRFIGDDDASHLFAASDYVLLSYDANFVSASSVLHVALKFRKPVLASSGGGHLKWAVENYGLGIWTQPDSLDALQKGLKCLLEAELAPRWDDYERENTWEHNAYLILEGFETTGSA